MPGLDLIDIQKQFAPDQPPLFDHFSVSFDPNEFIVILGPSGCGKSTLLNMIAGLETMDGGKIMMGDKDISKLDPKDREIAMVFQNYALYPHKTVYGNLEFGLIMRKVPKEAREKRIREVAEALDLTPLLDRRPRQLSGGQRQRVALGRAIVRDPELFLLDEPLSNLDAELRVRMRAEIMKLFKRLKRTMIYVTHDQVEAMTMADRILLLNHGQIQQFDKPQVLYNEPANLFVAQFIGTPKMNIWKVPVKDQSIEIFDQVIPLPGAYDQDEIYIGLRAENIQLSENGPFNVNYVENLGNEKIMYLYEGDMEVVARQSIKAHDDATYTVHFDPSKLLWFDALSGQAQFSGGK